MTSAVRREYEAGMSRQSNLSTAASPIVRVKHSPRNPSLGMLKVDCRRSRAAGLMNPYVIHGMTGIPDCTNFYCSVDAQDGPEELARLFAQPDWRVRKCSWIDYEARSDFAELVIASSGPILVHGPVANVLVNSLRIVDLFAAAGLSVTFECYDEGHELLLQRRFGNLAGPAWSAR